LVASPATRSRLIDHHHHASLQRLLAARVSQHSQGITSGFQQPGAGTFTIMTTGTGSRHRLLGFGVDADINDTVTLFLDYQTEVGASDFFGQSGQGGVKLAF